MLNKLITASILSILLYSCSEPYESPTCITGDCDAKMIFPVNADENGFYHVKLDWSRDFLPYFTVEVEASPVSSEYTYNNESHVIANFDSDTIWTIGESVVYTEPLYNPFTGYFSSSGFMLPAGFTTVSLDQFIGTTVNIVQNKGILFKREGSKLKSKRVVGPIPPMAIGDTITLYMKVYWDAGTNSQWKNGYKQKFIVE